MDTTALKNFAQEARRQLLGQVAARLEQVLTTDSAALREKEAAIKQLRAKVEEHGKQPIIAEVAYTWFNRLCALRYMDVNHYTRVGVVSPAGGFTQPEILQQAKQGLFDPDWQLDRKRVTGLLNGSVPSPDGDQEAYRLLLVAACNSYNRQMDFLFTAIQDEAELLMPEDLLSNQSVLQAVRDTLTPEVCQDVEVIGWLYQFYISEKKDQVMAAKGAVKKEDIPAVTQLFTPDWIVRYMVQNSLGRLWLLNYPDSNIRGQMEYYVQPADPETDFLRISSPEELKLLDPACGSGHILTYAFDLLVAIYEEQGYDPVRIPRLILEKNLYGIEIDKRAAMLSSFALMMKARAKDKRFFSRGVKPNILEMGDVSFQPAEIKAYLDKLGRDLYTQDLWEGLQQFENASTFGSLIRPVIKDVPTLRERMRETRILEDLLLSNTNDKLLKVLEMSEYLSPRYQVVVANPPYFSKGMDAGYKQFARQNYPDSKSDTLTMFMERNLDLAKKGGYVSMITLMSWMFLSSFEKLREKLLSQDTILNMAHLGARAFDTIGGEVVSTTMFALRNVAHDGHVGDYFRLIDGRSEAEKLTSMKQAIANPDCGWLYRASDQDFKKIPSAPIAYWVKNFENFLHQSLSDFFVSGGRNKTHDNERYVRFVWEVSKDNVKWKGYCNGGEFRKWFGNEYYFVDWSTAARKFYDSKGGLVNPMFQNAEGITWPLITSGKNSFRKKICQNLYSSGSPTIIKPDHKCDHLTLGFLNSKVSAYYLEAINPTLNTTVNDILKLPTVIQKDSRVENNTEELIDIAELDWNMFETSNSFACSPLIQTIDKKEIPTLLETYSKLLSMLYKSIEANQHMEEENNRIFIEAYGLQDELTSEVPLEEITLTCNPHYRYKGNYTDEEREARLLQDTMKEFLSYAVGCMFGRYALDKPGLILANQGETLQDYLRVIGKEPIFTPTETNVIPILEGDWFADDITARFKQFLKITFGDPNYEANLRFIEGALGKDLRRYFLKDFYKDHLQTYKKRPIYWLFSSPRGSFNALIYMHRYQPDTVSVVLNSYLREYRERLEKQRRYLESVSSSGTSSAREKTAALKESENLARMQAELKSYEDEVLFPLAGKRISIDLDDGVVVNYAKFGEALRKIG